MNPEESDRLARVIKNSPWVQQNCPSPQAHSEVSHAGDDDSTISRDQEAPNVPQAPSKVGVSRSPMMRPRKGQYFKSHAELRRQTSIGVGKFKETGPRGEGTVKLF